MKVDLFVFGFRKIIKQEISAFRRQSLQAFIQTLAGKTRLLRRVHGDRYLVNIQMSSLFAQRFTIDVFGYAEAIPEQVVDFPRGNFQDHTVDGFIRKFVSKVAVSQGKESAQSKSQALVLFTCALGIRAEPLEKSRKTILSYFLFQRCIRQRLRPRSDG